MPVASVRDCQFVASPSSNVRGRELRADREVRVAQWATVLRCVQANAARCIRRALFRLREAARWVAPVVRWAHVRWALDRDCRLREPHLHVRVRVLLLRIAVRDSVIRVRVASRKDR